MWVRYVGKPRYARYQDGTGKAKVYPGLVRLLRFDATESLLEWETSTGPVRAWVPRGDVQGVKA